jgi:hypothetical protein
MRELYYQGIDRSLYNKEIVGLLSGRHEFRGKQELNMETELYIEIVLIKNSYYTIIMHDQTPKFL